MDEDEVKHRILMLQGQTEALRIALTALLNYLDEPARQAVRRALAERAVIDGEPPQIRDGFLLEAANLARSIH